MPVPALVIQSVARLVSYCDASKVDEFQVRMFIESLAQFKPEEVRRAVDAYIAEAPNRFWPPIRTLRHLILDERIGLPNGVEAWMMVVEAIEQGRYSALPSEVRRAMNAIGGPRYLRTSDRPSYVRKEFLEGYEALRKSIYETENLTLAGLKPAAAKQVAEGEQRELMPPEPEVDPQGAAKARAHLNRLLEGKEEDS